jgi:hypothetical protein
LKVDFILEALAMNTPVDGFKLVNFYRRMRWYLEYAEAETSKLARAVSLQIVLLSDRQKMVRRRPHNNAAAQPMASVAGTRARNQAVKKASAPPPYFGTCI